MSSQQAPGQLPAFPHTLGIFPAFIARQSEHIKLKERILSLSSDSFDIELYPSRQPILQVQGKAISFSGRKHVRDMAGNHLFDIRSEVFSFPKTYFCEDPQGRRFFDVKGKFSFGTSKAVGKFSYPDSQNGGQLRESSLMMKGDFFDREAVITDEATGQVVARIDRQFFNARQLFAGQQTYIVTVAPNVDMVLICAMCICLDERRNER